MSLNRLRSGGTLANSPATRSAWGVAALMAGATAAGGGASYILDTYTANAAYSVRQLKSGVTNLIRVREDSGGTEADIGISSGWLDESALAAHCTTNNGFVKTIYDQSGNSQDFTQTTAALQRQIYNGTTTILENGKPNMFATAGGNQGYSLAITPASTQPYTIFAVGASTGATTEFLLNNPRISSSSAGALAISAGNILQSAVGWNTQALISVLFNGASSKGRFNGSEVISGDAGANGSGTVILGNDAISGADCIEGVQEVVFLTGDQSANFSTIESDIATAFSITLP